MPRYQNHLNTYLPANQPLHFTERYSLKWSLVSAKPSPDQLDQIAVLWRRSDCGNVLSNVTPDKLDWTLL